MPDNSMCSDSSGRFVPLVDRNKCEGKADCVRVCPFSVFEIRPLNKDEKSNLSLRGRLKAWAHGNKQAFVVKPDECHACNLCVKSCPENALSLVKSSQAHDNF